MKRIVFPATNRVHLARQKLLLDELRKHFIVDIFEPQTPMEGGMSVFSILCAVEFNNFLSKNQYDCVLIRGDRYEMLPLAMVSAYRGIPIAHIEGGDLSSVIDNRVRHAITHLADYHFVTNEESHVRLLHMGVPIGRVWNFGSLDVEFAAKVKKKRLRNDNYILCAYHAIEGEDESQVTSALEGLPVVGIRGNKDYGKEYGTESYSPEDYVNLMRGAMVCVGNSSSLLKEASVLGVNVVLVGERQNKRLTPRNVLRVPCDQLHIENGINFQLKNPPTTDTIYYKKHTSKNIAKQLHDLLYTN